MSDWLKNLQDAWQIIDATACQLRLDADRVKWIGLNPLAHSMYVNATWLQQGLDLLQKGTDEAVDKYVASTHQTTTNMMAAALAGFQTRQQEAAKIVSEMAANQYPYGEAEWKPEWEEDENG